MRQRLKQVLRRLGLLGLFRFLFHTARLARPSLIAREIAFRFRGGPDRLPFPPPRLVFLTIGCGWGVVSYDSGRMIVSKMISDLESCSIDIRAFRSILDFGCGCGRLIRHLSARSDAELHGTDYNPDLVSWCRRNLPFARFAVNDLAPPLSYRDGMFDFVYARSVLTHLDRDLQKAWMRELGRVLRPGGILYFSTHGAQFLDQLTGEEIRAYEKGDLIAHNPDVEGENLCSSFHSLKAVENHLLEGFEMVAQIPGLAQEHLRQDVYIVRAR